MRRGFWLGSDTKCARCFPRSAAGSRAHEMGFKRCDGQHPVWSGFELWSRQGRAGHSRGMGLALGGRLTASRGRGKALRPRRAPGCSGRGEQAAGHGHPAAEGLWKWRWQGQQGQRERCPAAKASLSGLLANGD